jgi:hypothetical protein
MPLVHALAVAAAASCQQAQSVCSRFLQTPAVVITSGASQFASLPPEYTVPSSNVLAALQALPTGAPYLGLAFTWCTGRARSTPCRRRSKQVLCHDVVCTYKARLAWLVSGMQGAVCLGESIMNLCRNLCVSCCLLSLKLCVLGGCNCCNRNARAHLLLATRAKRFLFLCAFCTPTLAPEKSTNACTTCVPRAGPWEQTALLLGSARWLTWAEQRCCSCCGRRLCSNMTVKPRRCARCS